MKYEIRNRFTGDVQFTAEIDCDKNANVGVKVGLSVRWGYSTGADLRGAVLRDADLTRAVLRDADLRGAVLRDADLTRAVLRGAVLRGADLTRAVLRDADLTRADLTRAVLRGAVLRGAVLRGADLTRADLTDAVLTGADLTRADLRGAVLTGADLRGAVLRDADLRGAVLRDADLRDVPKIENIDAKILAAIEANKAAGTNGLEMSGWHGRECNETNWCETTHCRAGYAVAIAGKAGFDLERKVGMPMAGILLYLKSTPYEPIPDWYCSNDEAMDDIRARAAKQTGGAS